VNLPNATHALVERSKIVEYLLASDHPEGGGKADFFRRFGFTAEDWQILSNALVAHAGKHSVSSMSESKHGTKYRIDGPLQCPDGRSPSIRTIGIIDVRTSVPRLVTAYPLQ